MQNLPLCSSDSRSRLPELTRRIFESYAQSPAVDRLDRCPLPNKETIVEILGDLNEILFPGYRRRDRLNMSNVLYYVGNLVDKIFDSLSVQVARALCGAGSDACDSGKRSEYEKQGEEKTLQFVSQIPDIRAALAKDAEAALKGDPACKSIDEVIFCYPGFDAIVVYRIARALRELGVPLVPRIMTEIASCFLFGFVWQWTDIFYTRLFLPSSSISIYSNQMAGMVSRMGRYFSNDASKPIIVPNARQQQLIFIAVLICVVPLIILYLFTQRTFVESLAMSGSKE